MNSSRLLIIYLWEVPNLLLRRKKAGGEALACHPRHPISKSLYVGKICEQIAAWCGALWSNNSRNVLVFLAANRRPWLLLSRIVSFKSINHKPEVPKIASRLLFPFLVESRVYILGSHPGFVPGSVPGFILGCIPDFMSYGLWSTFAILPEVIPQMDWETEFDDRLHARFRWPQRDSWYMAGVGALYPSCSRPSCCLVILMIVGATNLYPINVVCIAIIWSKPRWCRMLRIHQSGCSQC